MSLSETDDASATPAPAPVEDTPTVADDEPFKEEDFITPDDDDDVADDTEDSTDDGDAAEEDDDQDDADTDPDDEEDDGEGDDEDQPPELVTIEHDGVEYEVPPALQDGFMLKADHTRKTQELAEQRTQVEETAAHNAKVLQLREAQFVDAAELYGIDQQLSQFDKINWDALAIDDPVEASRLNIMRQNLSNQRDIANQRLQQKVGEAAKLQHEDLVERAATTRSELAQEIDGWSPEVEQGMAEYAISKGANEQQLRTTVDKPLLSILHDAYKWDQHLKAQAKAKAEAEKKGKVKRKPKPATPVAKVKGRRQGGRKDPDKMPIDDWVRQRNKQVAEREGRA